MDTYDGISEQDWRKELTFQREWNKRHLLSLFSMLGIPQSMLDVGCGDGTMVGLARDLGVDAYGVDQLIDKDENERWYFHHNLVNLFTLETNAHRVTSIAVNLVLCLEVAEHLDASAHATLCDTLTLNLKVGRGNYLVFSAAFPNQGGMGHIAERPSKYWLNQFSLRGMNYRRDLTTQLSLLWSNIDSPLYWLASNVLIFER